VLLDKLRVRGKLALIVALPVLALLLASAPLIVGRIQVAVDASLTARTARTAIEASSLIRELQTERLQSVGYLSGLVDADRLKLQGLRTVDQVADLRSTLGSDIPPKLAVAVDRLKDLEAIRAGVLGTGRDLGRAQAVIEAYSEATDELINGIGLAEFVDRSSHTAQEEVALDAMLRNNELVTRSGASLVVMVATKDPRAAGQVTDAIAGAAANLARFTAVAGPNQLALYEQVDKAYAARGGDTLQLALHANPELVIGFRPLSLIYPRLESLNELGRFVEREIAADVLKDSSEAATQAAASAWILGAGMLVFLLLVITLSIAVARSIAVPLRRLTTSAGAVAQIAEGELVRVADDDADDQRTVTVSPIAMPAKDELGDLAGAFNRVQVSSAQLVERQKAGRRNVALMFGHIGRRTQNLVGRQLALIDQLEQVERDPERLRSLYRLDHVTSRLRRNASSLVVLSGAHDIEDLSEPAPLLDVIRSSIGEIEDYARITVGGIVPIRLAPGLVGDLVLMLAELLDNATSFSPPHTTIEVDAENIESYCRIRIIDHGLGLPDDRIAEENARLLQRERLDLVPTDVLGLFVVGRLARRHGVPVALEATPEGGVTAIIDVPHRYFASTGDLQGVGSAAVIETPDDADLAMAGYSPGRDGAPQFAPVLSLVPDSRPESTSEVVELTKRERPAADQEPPTVQFSLPALNGAPAVAEPDSDLQVESPVRAGPTELVESENPDFSALNRLAAMLTESEPWNGFTRPANRPATATATATAAPQPATDSLEAGTVDTEPTVPVDTQPGATGPNAVEAEVPRPAAARPAATDAGTAAAHARAAALSVVRPLRQRVPGAQLPDRARRNSARQRPANGGATAAPAAQDPASARALVEMFEAGVRKADEAIELGQDLAAPAAPSAALPGSAEPSTSGSTDTERSNTTDRSNAANGAEGPPAGGQGRLARRVPGASLREYEQSFKAPPASQATPPVEVDDPDRAKDTIEAFEAGADRAWEEIRTQHLIEEGRQA
jgi:methyl-accepting chemotaxis protein